MIFCWVDPVTLDTDKLESAFNNCDKKLRHMRDVSRRRFKILYRWYNLAIAELSRRYRIGREKPVSSRPIYSPKGVVELPDDPDYYNKKQLFSTY